MKKIVTIITSALLAVVMVFSLVACGGGSSGGLVIYRGEENISGKTVNVFVGDSIGLSLKNGGKDVASNMWRSSAPDVATVDNGKVTAVKVGTATISVKYQDGTKFPETSFTINVTEDTSKLFVLQSEAGTSLSIYNTGKARLDGTLLKYFDVAFELDYTVTDGALVFSDVETTNAVMNAAGVAAGWDQLLGGKEIEIYNIKTTVAGKYITVIGKKTDGTKEEDQDFGTFQLTDAQAEQLGVNTEGAVPVTGVTLNHTALTLDINEEYTLAATVSPETATLKTYTFTSSDAAKVAVDAATGKLTAKAKTETPVTVTVTTNDGNKTATCAVTVTDKTAIAFAANNDGVATTKTRIKFYEDGGVALAGSVVLDTISIDLTATYTYEDTLAIAAATKEVENIGTFTVTFAVAAVTGDDTKLEITVNASPETGDTQVWGKFVIAKSAFEAPEGPEITYTNSAASAKGEYQTDKDEGGKDDHSLEIKNDGTVILKSANGVEVKAKCSVADKLITNITVTEEGKAGNIFDTTTTFTVTAAGDNLVIAPVINVFGADYPEGPYTFAKSAITALNLADYAPAEPTEKSLLKITSTETENGFDKHTLEFFDNGKVKLTAGFGLIVQEFDYTVSGSTLTVTGKTGAVNDVVTSDIAFSYNADTKTITVTISNCVTNATGEANPAGNAVDNYTISTDDWAKLTPAS